MKTCKSCKYNEQGVCTLHSTYHYPKDMTLLNSQGHRKELSKIDFFGSEAISVTNCFGCLQHSMFFVKNGFKKISNHVYYATNQNGFNNALYDYFSFRLDPKPYKGFKKSVRDSVQTYPKKYPCFFVVIDQNFECGRTYVEEIEF